MNALEKVVDLLAAIILLFLVPIFYYGSGKNVSQAILAGQTAENFLKRISTSGQITLPVWLELEEALSVYGCTEIDLQRERFLHEPNPEGDIVNRIYMASKKNMLEQVLEEGKSRLQKGDWIKLTLYMNDIPTVYYDCIRTGETGE